VLQNRQLLFAGAYFKPPFASDCALFACLSSCKRHWRVELFSFSCTPYRCSALDAPPCLEGGLCFTAPRCARALAASGI